MNIKDLSKKQKRSLIIGVVFLILLVAGATYAYFQIDVNTSLTDSTISAETNKYGTATIKTDTTKLYLKLTNDLMGIDYLNQTYYANSDSSGTPLTTDPNYTLATASLADGDLAVDCTYNFKVTATVTKAITDGSDESVKITIGSTTKTLKELTTAGTSGVIVNGKISNLKVGTNKSINISSSVINTTSSQLGLGGNVYTITVEPYTSGNIKSFSCGLHKESFAEKLIASGKLWQSGLEGDGYRYIGSGAVGTSTNPNNFICFGTIDKTECTANQDKYMYRILGVFSDSNGDNHVKLIKYKQLGSYEWYVDPLTDISWDNSNTYKNLNGSYFLTNTTYDYLQNTKWSNKIENWTWSAVNTKTYEDKINITDYSKSSPKGIYLNEMHKASNGTLCTNYNSGAINCNGGTWTNPTAKIGLMYASDYALSLGSSALALTTGTVANAATLKTGWMHQSNNDITKSTLEWTLARYGDYGGYFHAWDVRTDGRVSNNSVNIKYGVRPVFYLTSDVNLSSGSETGTLSDPFIIE